MVKNLPAIQEIWVWSLGREDPLEKGMATHSSILIWRIPWTWEPGWLQLRGCKESDVTEQLTHTHTQTHTHYRTTPWKLKTSQILLLNLCLLANLENYTTLYIMMQFSVDFHTYENTYISLNHMKLPSSGSKMVDYWQLHVVPPATLNGFQRTPELRKFIMKNAQNKRLQTFCFISIIWLCPQNLISMADF